MSESVKQRVFSRNVIEFVTVAREYCSFAEQWESHTKVDFIDRSQKILSLLYLKALMLPDFEELFDEELEKYVTEFDYLFVKKGIEQIMGNADQYLDFFDTNMNETPEPVVNTVSENMADVYQDIKDFIEIYKTGQENLMNDALYVCRHGFEEYWGFRVVNTLRMLHYLQFGITSPDVLNDTPENSKFNTSDWFISRAQDKFNTHGPKIS